MNYKLKLYFWIFISLLWSFFEMIYIIIFNKTSKTSRYISAKINNEI